MRRSLLLVSLLSVLALIVASCGGGDAEETTTTEATTTTTAATTTTEATTTTTEPPFMAPEGALVSIPVAAAPALDGEVDALWADAEAITVGVSGGANSGKATVELKSVYSGDMVYFLMSWDDPTESFIRSPWEKQADGSWAKLKDPDDKGGDNNVWYEDKMSIIWNTAANAIANFEKTGCFGLCHAGENSDAKPYGNKYTANEGEIGDMWHWKAVRNLGQVDDQHVDAVRYSPETPGAGRHGDPKDGGGYVNNETEDKTLPAFMPPDGGAKDGSPGYILDAEKVEFDDALFEVGDRVPGIVKSEFTGDRGDLLAGWTYADGKWFVEIGRKMVTGSMYDVQFDDMAGMYYFGVATFDNAQVRHNYATEVNVLVFKP